MNDRIAGTRQCPYCRQWIPMPAHNTRRYFEAHKLNCPEVQYKGSPGDHRNPDEPRADETIKRADLWGNVTDTHQTETELNGHRASQGALL